MVQEHHITSERLDNLSEQSHSQKEPLFAAALKEQELSQTYSF